MDLDLDVFSYGGNGANGSDANGSGTNTGATQAQRSASLLDLSSIPALVPNSSGFSKKTGTTSVLSPAGPKPAPASDHELNLSHELRHASDFELFGPNLAAGVRAPANHRVSEPEASPPRESPPPGSSPRGSPPRGSPPRGSPPQGSPSLVLSPRGSPSHGSAQTRQTSGRQEDEHGGSFVEDSLLGDTEAYAPDSITREPIDLSSIAQQSVAPDSVAPESTTPGSLEPEEETGMRRSASTFGRYSQDSETNPFALITPYCDTQVLQSLTSTSRQAREAATTDSIWRPLCRTAGFDDTVEHENSLLHFADATTVLGLGYLDGSTSAYRTFSRAYNLLHEFIYSPADAVKQLDHLQRAQALGNAYLLVSAIHQRDAAVSGTDGGSPEPMPSELLETIKKSKESLLEEIASFVQRGEPTPPSLLHSVDVWTQKTADADITRRAIDAYLSKFSVTLEVDEAFTYFNDSDTRTKQVSQRKVEIAFSKVTASLIQVMAEVNDQNSPIPQSWRSRTWSHSLSKFMGTIAAYLQDVLEVAAKEMSELEYLVAVPRLYLASRALSTNSVLIEHGSEADFDVSEYIDLIIMKPIIEEFCERQSVYVGKYARDKVDTWNKSIAQREDETEEFLWSSVPKKSDKNNFISSFKWAFISADAEDDKTNNDSDGLKRNDGALSEETSAPATEFEAQTAVLVSKLRGMESLVSIELAIDVLETCRVAFRRLKTLGRANSQYCEPLFCLYLDVIGRGHIQLAFEKAIKVLNSYDPKRYGRLMISVGKTPGKRRGRIVSGPDGFKQETDENEDEDFGSGGDGDESNAVEPLAVFTELVNVGDLVQQMIHVFFEEELVGGHIVRQSDFGATSVNAKRRFEQMLDDMLAEGLSRGIDVLMDQVEFTLRTEQLGSDFSPLPTQEISVGPTAAAEKVINLVRSHLDLLRESTEKSLFDVFQQEVGARLYSSLSKHIKRQTISVDGAVNLISDVNAYYMFILSLRQKNLVPYYETLKQISQLYLIDKKDAKQIGYAISDSGRYNGLVGTEDILEFVKRRQDWPVIKPKVEKVLYGIFECVIC